MRYHLKGLTEIDGIKVLLMVNIQDRIMSPKATRNIWKCNDVRVSRSNSISSVRLTNSIVEVTVD